MLLLPLPIIPPHLVLLLPLLVIIHHFFPYPSSLPTSFTEQSSFPIHHPSPPPNHHPSLPLSRLLPGPSYTPLSSPLPSPIPPSSPRPSPSPSPPPEEPELAAFIRGLGLSPWTQQFLWSCQGSFSDSLRSTPSLPPSPPPEEEDQEEE